jgi:hypothetical protein
MGWTESVLNKCFASIDLEGRDVLYILPSKNPDASDFSASRFDAALELSPHLSKLFSDVKNVGHKRAGATNLYVRGSRSRSVLKSVPVSLIILDEVDEMTQDNIPLVFERASGQLIKQVCGISTPTINMFGIDKWYNASDQKHYFFKCPLCSRFIELRFPESFSGSEGPAFLLCTECKGVLQHEGKIEYLQDGEWVSQVPAAQALYSGYYINQLYSMTVSPAELNASYLRSISSPSDEQEFYNSKMGLPHIVEGARVTDTSLALAKSNYLTTDKIPQNGMITLGIDVGTWLHCVLTQYRSDIITSDVNSDSKARVLRAFKVASFEEIDNYIREYRPRAVVIDAQPERRKSLELASRFPGLIRVCYYARGVNGRALTERDYEISVDRTSWLDTALGRFQNGSISLPGDISEEFCINVKALVRHYEKDADGNPVGRWLKGEQNDHFAHALTYAEIALTLACSYGRNRDVG